jgi:hypothetical protein
MRKREFPQKDFAQGEVDVGWQSLRDKEVYYHSAAVLENWWPRADGWLDRRPAFVHETDWLEQMFWRNGTKRVRIFPHASGDWIVVVENVSDVYKAYIAKTNGGMVQAPGGGDEVLTLDLLEEELDDLDDGASFSFTTILTHFNYQPWVFTQAEGVYQNRQLAWDEDDDAVDAEIIRHLPVTRFAEDAAKITLTDISGSEPFTNVYEATSDVGVFKPNHAIGGSDDQIRIEIRGIQFRIYEYISATKVKLKAISAVPSDLTATDDWFEQAWSPMRNYPRTSAYWRKRLWLAGGTEVGNRMFVAGSVVGEPYNFDDKDATGDASIQLTIQESATQSELIQHLVPDGNRLLVFTNAGVWAIQDNGSSDGLTVATIEVRRLVQIDIANVRPTVFNGTPVFAMSNRRSLMELRFSRERGTHFMQPLATTIRHRLGPVGRIRRMVSIRDYLVHGRQLLGILTDTGEILVSPLTLEVPGWIVWTCNNHPLATDLASNARATVAVNQIGNYRVMGRLYPGYEVDYSINASSNSDRSAEGGYVGWITGNVTTGREATYRRAPHSRQHFNEAQDFYVAEAGLGFANKVQVLPPSLGQQGAWMTAIRSRLIELHLAVEGMRLMPWLTVDGTTWEIDHFYDHNGVRHDIQDFDETQLTVANGETPSTIRMRLRVPLPPVQPEAEPMETLVFGGEAFCRLLGLERVYTY